MTHLRSTLWSLGGIAVLSLIVKAVLSGPEANAESVLVKRDEAAPPVLGSDGRRSVVEAGGLVTHEARADAASGWQQGPTSGSHADQRQLQTLLETEQGRHFLLRAGSVSREEFGAEYDAEVRGLAWSNCQRAVRGLVESETARTCGFESWDDLYEALGPNSKLQPSEKDGLQVLVDTALVTQASAEAAAIASWTDGRTVEAWEAGRAHDRIAWKEQVTGRDPKGLLRLQASTRIGPHAFCLHFNSANHPLLDVEIQSLRAQAVAFWTSVAEG